MDEAQVFDADGVAHMHYMEFLFMKPIAPTKLRH
jgi:hypothetical protein